MTDHNQAWGKIFSELLLGKIDFINRHANRWIESQLAPHGITMADFRIVGALLNSPEGINQKQLCDRLQVRPATFSVAIDKLEEKGVVKRYSDPKDSRVKHIKFLATSKMPAVQNILQTLEQTATQHIKKSDIRQLQTILDKMVQNMHQLKQA